MYLFFLLQIWEGRQLSVPGQKCVTIQYYCSWDPCTSTDFAKQNLFGNCSREKKIRFSTQTANKLFTGFFPECSVIQFSNKRWYIPETLETFLLSIVCQSISSCEIWRFSTLAKASYLETYKHFFGSWESAT